MAVRKGSPYRRAEFARRQRITIEDFSTWITSKEDIIIFKLWWAKGSHSELHLRDAKNLVANGCAAAYIARWPRELGRLNLPWGLSSGTRWTFFVPVGNSSTDIRA